MAIVVKKKKGESKVELINRFRKIFLEEGIIDQVKEKVHYVKPSRKRYERRKEIDHKIKLDQKRLANG
jgi:ribosomal protein S21